MTIVNVRAAIEHIPIVETLSNKSRRPSRLTSANLEKSRPIY